MILRCDMPDWRPLPAPLCDLVGFSDGHGLVAATITPGPIKDQLGSRLLSRTRRFPLGPFLFLLVTPSPSSHRLPPTYHVSSDSRCRRPPIYPRTLTQPSFPLLSPPCHHWPTRDLCGAHRCAPGSYSPTPFTGCLPPPAVGSYCLLAHNPSSPPKVLPL
jgi:hypothetical protein